VQDAFIKLWENCKKIPPKSAKSYLFKTANNMMLNDMRHKKVVLKFQKAKPKEYTNENPEFLMQKNQFLESYQTALGNLKEEQRVAFLLYKIDGKSYGEIGELMNVTSRVIEYRVVTALKKLKNEIEDFTIK
jgi:RNA polymerase sigma-70 factor (ECF subfamily)